MYPVTEILIETIEKCSLPKFSDYCDKKEMHQELMSWQNNLKKNFSEVIRLMSKLNTKKLDSKIRASAFSALYILYYELLSDLDVKTEYFRECSVKLNKKFKLLYNVPINELFHDNSLCNKQELFEKTMETLHLKLTHKDFKAYPVHIQVYVNIVKEIETCAVLDPNKVLPISLFLIDDFEIHNKKVGLDCCLTILTCLTEDHFVQGNYYEVVYEVLKKSLAEKDLEITNLVLKCLLCLIKISPKHVKISMVDDSLIVLDQMHTETNLYRKKAYFQFLNEIIPIHGIHCVKRKMFLIVICDNLDICSNQPVCDILLTEVLECLENWIKYCWCIWKLAPNKKLLPMLIKIFYITFEDEVIAAKIHNIFVTLCKLCTDDEQKMLNNSLEKSIDDMKIYNAVFAEKLHSIKKELSV